MTFNWAEYRKQKSEQQKQRENERNQPPLVPFVTVPAPPILTLGMQFFGDPPPGRSALDQKRR